MRKYLDHTGLQRLIRWIKDTFVQKESGKVLSSNDYTNEDKEKLGRVKDTTATTSQDGMMAAADKQKLDGIAVGAEVNTIIQIKRNGTIVQPDSRVVDVSVPINVSELTNDRQYQTRSEVQQLISQAGTMRKEIVSTLPQIGAENTIYLKGPKAGDNGNIYEEYLWIAGKWEKIGDTSTNVDLSEYLKKAEVIAITDQEIEQIVNGG